VQQTDRALHAWHGAPRLRVGRTTD
jgi:hypothetical protein